MKITFQNANDVLMDHANGREPNLRQEGRKTVNQNASKLFQGAVKVGGNEGSMDRMIAGNDQQGGAYGGIGNMAQLQQMAGAVDGKAQQDLMTLMSNTMSEEDYGKMLRDGFSPRDMDPEETVTILDKIKAELAKAGKQVAGYNDDLDEQTLEAALGSQTLALAVSRSFSDADLSLTEETVTEIGEAWKMASYLKKPTDGECEYMIRENLPPRIVDLYKAEASGAGDGKHGNAMYYASGVQGYYAQAGNGAQSVDPDTRFQEQVDEVIRKSSLEDLEEGREYAKWLLDKNLPLTPDNLEKYKELTNVSFPVSEENFALAVRDAIIEGKSPKYANLSRVDQENIYEKANRLAAEYERSEMADRRLLEEVRLHMTSEVNVKLLRSGFSIDTAPMEELVEALKMAERQVAEEYFKGAENAVDKYQTYQSVNRMVTDFPSLPAKLLGVMRVEPAEEIPQLPNGTEAGEYGELHTMEEIYRAGHRMRQAMEQANESYETMMTVPRADLGDSIRKAFSNVDDVLADLGYETSEENRKVIRILGYNRMELTSENLERVRDAGRIVSDVMQQMTPASVLKMIKDDFNPLEKSFQELQDYFKTQENTPERVTEGYARFLYRLERNNEITKEERESFIGIYRMLHQIEKRDEAAVGMVVNTGAELRFGNLLAAARTGNFGFMDVRLTDQEETYLKLVKGEGSIDDQINKAFTKQERQAFLAAGDVSKEAGELLTAGGVETTVNNLLAADGLLSDVNSPFGMWKNKKEEVSGQEENTELDTLWEQMDEEDFAQQYREKLSMLREEVQNVTTDAESYVDLRRLQMTSLQLGIAIGLRDHGVEEYYLPLEMGDEPGRLHLTLGSEPGAKGSVTVEVEAFGSKTRAAFQVSRGRVSATFEGNGESEVMKLSEAADILSASLRETFGWSMDEKPAIIDRAKVGDMKGTANKGKTQNRPLTGLGSRYEMTGGDEDTQEEVSSRDLLRLAKAWIKAMTRKEVAYEN